MFKFVLAGVASKYGVEMENECFLILIHAATRLLLPPEPEQLVAGDTVYLNGRMVVILQATGTQAVVRWLEGPTAGRMEITDMARLSTSSNKTGTTFSLTHRKFLLCVYL